LEPARLHPASANSSRTGKAPNRRVIIARIVVPRPGIRSLMPRQGVIAIASMARHDADKLLRE
jgi:hypothetical protein